MYNERVETLKDILTGWRHLKYVYKVSINEYSKFIRLLKETKRYTHVAYEKLKILVEILILTYLKEFNASPFSNSNAIYVVL